MTRRRWFAASVVAAVALSACAGSGGSDGSGDLSDADPGDCITVDMAVSSEKIALLTELAEEFNNSDDAEIDEGCVFVRPYSKASGGAAQLIVDGWPNPEANGEPARDLVARRVRMGRNRQRTGRRRARSGRHAVHAHAARDRACRSRWPRRSDGRTSRSGSPTSSSSPTTRRDGRRSATRSGARSDSARPTRTSRPAGSTSPIAEYYAATGKTRGLTTEDLNRPEAIDVRAATSSRAVVHYGDITMTFLNNWFAADVRGTSLTYASRGGGRGEERHRLQPRQPRRRARPPARRLAYPACRSSRSTRARARSSPTTRSSSSTPSGSTADEQKLAASAFEEYVQRPENQAQGPRVRIPAEQPERAPRRSDRARPTASTRPAAEPSSRCRRRRCSSASSTRGPSSARRRASCSCSTSRARWANRPADGRDQARPRQGGGGQRARPVQGHRRGRAVGVQHRSRRCRSELPRGRTRRRRSASNAKAARQQIRAQFPTNGTPLYEVTSKAYATMLDDIRPGEDQRHRVADRRRQRRRRHP